MKRKRVRAKRLDVTDLRALVEDHRVWFFHAVVIDPDGAGQHFDLDEEDLFIEIETQPGQLDLTARLGSAFGGPGEGLWHIPPVGAEVVVALPAGRIDFQPTIVSVLSGGLLPARVSNDRTVFVTEKDLEITAPKVYLGPSPDTIVEASDGLVHGSGIDPFSGQTYAALMNTTDKVFSKK